MYESNNLLHCLAFLKFERWFWTALFSLFTNYYIMCIASTIRSISKLSRAFAILLINWMCTSAWVFSYFSHLLPVYSQIYIDWVSNTTYVWNVASCKIVWRKRIMTKKISHTKKGRSETSGYSIHKTLGWMSVDLRQANTQNKGAFINQENQNALYNQLSFNRRWRKWWRLVHCPMMNAQVLLSAMQL